MLDLTQIDRVAGAAARVALSAQSFLRAQSEPTTDSDGHEALLVTLVINDLGRSPVSGEAASNAIVRVKQELRQAGEDRTAIVEFATEGDLATDGGA